MPFLFALALIFTASVGAVEVRVTTLDGDTSAGTVQRWDQQAIVLSGPDGHALDLPLERVLRVDRVPTPIDRNSPPSQVLLVDGSRIAMHDFITNGPNSSFAGALGRTVEMGPLTAPLNAVQAARLMPLDENVPSLASEWRELLASNPAGDLIVIRKPGAANLNFVEGTLGDVTAQSVQFDLDGETIDVNRAKIFGLIYFRQSKESAPPVAMVIGPHFRLPVTAVELAGDQLTVQSSTLGTIELPTSAVSAVDFSLDRLQYLSDLEPVRANWTPPSTSAATKPLFGHIARDRGFYSPRLALEFPIESLSPEVASSSGLSETTVYEKGLALRSRTVATYRVPRGFSTFRAVAGIDPRTRSTGEVVLTVQGDGKLPFQKTVRGVDAPTELECTVTSVKELTIIVDFGSTNAWSRGTGDNLHLGGARFIK